MGVLVGGPIDIDAIVPDGGGLGVKMSPLSVLTYPRLEPHADASVTTHTSSGAGDAATDGARQRYPRIFASLHTELNLLTMVFAALTDRV